jgi:hypothetical protein
MKTGTKSRRAPKKPISAEARKLILGTVRRCKSQRLAAKLLGLKNHMHLIRMLSGEMSETPQMHAAVLRARERARRAFIMQKPEPIKCDMEKIKSSIDDLKWVVEVLESYVK